MTTGRGRRPRCSLAKRRHALPRPEWKAPQGKRGHYQAWRDPERRADTPHVAECVGNAPTIGLHGYGGDIFELPRRMWHPQTLEEHPLDWALYPEFARIATEAQAAPGP